MKVLVINGPNLNLLGTREPDIYGSETLAQIGARCVAVGSEHGIDIDFRQSNHEGEIVDWIQEAIGVAGALVLNAAGYTHTSVAIHDALLCYPGFKVELHISNPHLREPFRHHSYVSTAVDAVMAGLGPIGYELLIEMLPELIESTGRDPKRPS